MGIEAVAELVRRIRQEARDLVELVLLPGLAAVLPWPWCFWVFKRLARWRWLYRDASERALKQAVQRGWVKDDAAWAAARRLVTLVDHADYYLAVSRSDRWLKRHMQVDGAWPARDSAAVLCTFHWGAGMWGLRHAAVSGMSGHPLVAPLQRAHFPGRSVLYWYACKRTACVGRVVGQPTLDVSASLRPVLRALRAGEQVMAAVDVPADQVSASTTVPLLNLYARVPTALLRVAVEQQVPVVVYMTGVDLGTGGRFLRLRAMPATHDVDVMAQQVFAQLGGLITQDPAAWHFWSEAERLFVPCPGTDGGP